MSEPHGYTVGDTVELPLDLVFGEHAQAISQSLETVEPVHYEVKPTETFNYAPTYRMLENGFSWNPYLKYPRNKECYCGSGKKFKKCCLETEALAIPKKAAEIAKPLIDRVRK